MDSNFLFMSQITFWVTQKTRYSTSACTKIDLLISHLRPFSSMCCGVSYKFSNRSDQSILVITKNSFMHAQINSNTQNISFIFSWNMSGELLTNLGRCLYRYFTHARIIIHRLINGWIDLLIESIDLLIRGRIYFYGLMDLLFHIWIY